MLIVGGGLMTAAITVFLAWQGLRRCRELWRERNAGRMVAEEHSE